MTFGVSVFGFAAHSLVNYISKLVIVQLERYCVLFCFLNINFDAIIHVYNQTKHLLISLQVKLRFSILFTAWGIDYKRALMSKTYHYMLVSWCGKGLNLKCYKNFSLKRRQFSLRVCNHFNVYPMWKQTCIFLTFFSRNLQGTNQVLLILHFLPLNNQFDKNPSVLLYVIFQRLF